MRNKLEERTFSGRLADIVERYDAIAANTEMPPLTKTEVLILSEVFGGSEISPTKIKYLHEDVLHCATGTEEERQLLAKKVETWTAAEKVMFPETYFKK